MTKNLKNPLKKADELDLKENNQAKDPREEEHKKEDSQKIKKSGDTDKKTTETKTGTHKNRLTPKKYQHGKKYREVAKLIEKSKEYSIDEALSLIKKTSQTNFDATVEIHVNLNIDPSNAEHQIRGSVALPSGLGKEKRVCVITNIDKEKEARDAGADTVGGQEIINKIEQGWLDFDVLVATPDTMGLIGKVGKILGTKGLMPNPKNGTVTNELAKTIAEIKKGRAEYKIDKQGSLHSAIGKVSMKEDDLKANLEAYLSAVSHSKPNSVKGVFIKSIYLSTTMGPSVKVQK